MNDPGASAVTQTSAVRVGSADGSGLMFDRIARRYDLMNRLISFGLDGNWRKKLLANLGPLQANDYALDVATGTGDVALAIARCFPGTPVKGLDPSVGMLEVGRRKVKTAGYEGIVDLIEGDAQAMPFDDDTFTASCISFGIRNVPGRSRGLKEMTRVTRSGGRVVVLELSEPQTGWLAPFARFHIHHVIPLLGALLSGSREYRYLQKSIAAFPPAEEFAEMMRSAGLRDVKTHRLTLGTAHLYVGTVA